MAKEKCKLCDKDFITKYGYVWYPNGTWGKKDGLLLAFMGKEEILNIFGSIEKTLQRPIDRLLSLAKRIVTVNVVDQEFLGHLMKFLIKIRLVSNKRLTKILNQKFIAPIGWGICKKAEIDHSKKSALFIVKNYPSIPLIEGALSGLLQYIFNLPGVEINSREEGDKLKINVLPRKRDIGLAEYIPKPVLASELWLLPGNIEYNLCPKCKIPLDFSERYEWFLDEGRIVDRKTKKDQLLFTRYALDAILGLLKRELGSEDISKIIFEAEKGYIKNLYKNENEEKVLKALLSQKDFGLKGWGNLKELKEIEGGIEVKIENPFYVEILAGFVAGAYEAVKKEESKTEWQEKDNVLLIKIKVIKK